ncbi:MAG TPA: hypothetical protein PKN02_10865 [Thermotogota bacterium]|nr:hypothetical protein [Thermotogota bacterium]HQK80805.1 hypothetical protein [Thermotogota bacterium]
MKRRFMNIGICVLVFGLVVALNSCGAVGVVTLEDAKIQFIGWIGGQGVGEHAIGQYLGEVSAGDEVGSFNPAALPDGATERGSGPLSENGWLFYVDEWPGSFYSHPGRICVIGKSGRILYSVETQGWPVVNGVKPASMNRTFQAMLADTSMTIYNPKNIAIWPEFRWPVIVFRMRQFGAVVVNGLTPTQSLYTEASNIHAMMVDAMKKLFNSPTVAVDYVKRVENPNNKPTDVADAIRDLVENKKVNYIVLYYIAHGNIEYMSVGGTGFNASQLETLMASYPGVKFILFVETCHGGSWRDYFRDLSPRLLNLKMVIASTSRDQGAYPDWDVAHGQTDVNGNDDQWIEFTSDFLLKMEYYTSEAHWGEVTGLTFPAFDNNILRLFWLCYQRAQNDSWILPQNTGHQSPQIFYP